MSSPMRLSSQPQRHVVLLSSWRISRRGSSAGNGSRFGVRFGAGAGALGRARSSRAAKSARSASIVSSSRLRCTALNTSLFAANFSRFNTAISCVSFSFNAVACSSCACSASTVWRSCWTSNVSRDSVLITQCDNAASRAVVHQVRARSTAP